MPGFKGRWGKKWIAHVNSQLCADQSAQWQLRLIVLIKAKGILDLEQICIFYLEDEFGIIKIQFF